jgi:excisionase family DNA binding protein
MNSSKQTKVGTPEQSTQQRKPVWVTPAEAVKLTGIGRTLLYELIDDGTLKSIRVRSKRLILFESIEKLGENSASSNSN